MRYSGRYRCSIYENFQSITGKFDEPAPVLLENLRSYRDFSSHFASGVLSYIGSYIERQLYSLMERSSAPFAQSTRNLGNSVSYRPSFWSC